MPVSRGVAEMFTGIVEEVGSVLQAGPRLAVAAAKVVEDSESGASIAVNAFQANPCMPASHSSVKRIRLTSSETPRSSLARWYC